MKGPEKVTGSQCMMSSHPLIAVLVPFERFPSLASMNFTIHWVAIQLGQAKLHCKSQYRLIREEQKGTNK